MAACQSMQFENIKVLVLECFNRVGWTHPSGDRRLIRLPQEDRCQDTGMPPLKQSTRPMALRSKNAHWKMRNILRRHWVAFARRHGVLTEDGREAQFLIDDLVLRTPQVIATVSALLPDGFAAQVADIVFDGLRDAANRLAG